MPHPYTTLILAAGGSSRRMGGTDKLFEPIAGGLSAAAFVLTAAQVCGCIDEIVVAARDENFPAFRELARRFGVTKLKGLVINGETRQQSVFGAAEAASPQTRFFAVHDAARPFASPELIDRICRDAYTYGAAIPAVPLKDTVKETADGFVGHTLPRERLIAAQTPQVFDAELYRRAMRLAVQSGREFTDDCQLMEMIGARVFLSAGEERNLKLTTPCDLALAAVTAQQMGKEGILCVSETATTSTVWCRTEH